LGIGNSAGLRVRSPPLAGKVCAWPSQGQFLPLFRFVEGSFGRDFPHYSARRNFTKSFQKRLFFHLEVKRKINYNSFVICAGCASSKKAKVFGSVAQENGLFFVHVSKTFLKFSKKH
jgi:hypothetical protein